MLDDLTASHASVTGRRTDILGWNQLAAALFRQSVNRPEGSWSPVPWAMLIPAWTAPRERSSWWSPAPTDCARVRPDVVRRPAAA
ncbi:MmyB family transcriptional regulator [Streptomyces europaeiscabiei]|uniref:MmyB family transcriptional regulator n=1 Tax=Streptomyces europaeiscabiei TaxID=146819 RepID=UPI0038D3949C